MFQKARFRLTAWYLVIIMAVSLFFSSIIYHAATTEFIRFERMQRSRFERRLEQSGMPQDNIMLVPPLPPNQELIEEAERRIFIMLAILNGGILAISGVLGYILAGINLKPIQEMMHEQNRFISDASHELKTPLTSLKTAMEVYLRDKKKTTAEATILIKESIEEVDKLQILSESLLQLAQFQQPEMKLVFESTSILHLLQQAVKKTHALAQNKNIDIIISESEDVFVEVNKFTFSDLFIILLDNAIKYSPEKTTITVSFKKIDSHVKITVQDKGYGIAEKEIEHIFKRFYRADAARSRNLHGGYGLGLSIAKKIVDFHKGTIHVQSREKEGSTFVITIPTKHSGTFQLANI